MIYKINDTRTFQGITLSNPTWKVNGVRYCWVENKAHIEVHLTEGVHWHSRTWACDATNDMTSDDCVNYILSLPEFEGSEEI